MDTGIKDELLDRLKMIQATLDQLLTKQAAKEHYTIEEFAAIVGKAVFTCREWARLSRINATKRHSGRGKYQEWVVSHEELKRYQAHGLLPQPGTCPGRAET